MTSDKPEVSIENDAVLKLEEKCDSSFNADMTNALNKKLRNDTCPDDFEMAEGSNYCLHATATPMTYDEAAKHCNTLSGSSLFYLESIDDLSASEKFLHFSGNVVFVGN